VKSVALGTVLAGALVFGACAGAGQRRVFPPPILDRADVESAPALDAARTAPIVARAREYESRTGNFSATVAVSMHDFARSQTFASHGAIAVRRPESMRMQMSGPGGVTALDLLARGERYWLRVAGREWVAGSLSDPPAQGFPAGTVARAFLGFDWDHADALDDGPLALVRVPSPGGHAVVAVDTRDGALREVRWFARGVERARVRFAEFELQDGVRYPRVVLFWQHDPDVTSTITVEQRTVAPALPAQTFAPPG
jgi:hypothetical protein